MNNLYYDKNKVEYNPKEVFTLRFWFKICWMIFWAIIVILMVPNGGYGYLFNLSVHSINTGWAFGVLTGVCLWLMWHDPYWFQSWWLKRNL